MPELQYRPAVSPRPSPRGRLHQASRVATRTKITQEARLGLQFLSLARLELFARLEELAGSNPCLTWPEPPEEFAGNDSRNPAPWADLPAREEPFSVRLVRQIRAEVSDPGTCSALLRLAFLLSPEGYLPDDETIARELGLQPTAVHGLVRLLQSFDPPGIGARSGREALLLQLERLGEDHPSYETARLLLTSRGAAGWSPRQAARRLNLPLAEVQAALDLLARFSLAPALDDRSAPCSPPPDLVVDDATGSRQMRLAAGAQPNMHLDAYYVRLASGRTVPVDGADRAYLRHYLEAARRILTALAWRGETLVRIGSHLLRLQPSFPADGTGSLRPLRLEEVAADLGLHPSTVARALQDKWFAYGHGRYPLRILLGREGYPAGTVPAPVAEKIRQLVASESPEQPLTDQELCQALDRLGFHLSRRTAAKYRTLLGIPPSSLR